jgi:hypothetical protein
MCLLVICQNRTPLAFNSPQRFRWEQVSYPLRMGLGRGVEALSEFKIPAGLQPGGPQGLKPASLLESNGTAEAVPYPKTIY